MYAPLKAVGEDDDSPKDVVLVVRGMQAIQELFSAVTVRCALHRVGLAWYGK
jgi:hypothetical protein